MRKQANEVIFLCPWKNIEQQLEYAFTQVLMCNRKYILVLLLYFTYAYNYGANRNYLNNYNL